MFVCYWLSTKIHRVHQSYRWQYEASVRLINLIYFLTWSVTKNNNCFVFWKLSTKICFTQNVVIFKNQLEISLSFRPIQHCWTLQNVTVNSFWKYLLHSCLRTMFYCYCISNNSLYLRNGKRKYRRCHILFSSWHNNVLSTQRLGQLL